MYVVERDVDPLWGHISGLRSVRLVQTSYKPRHDQTRSFRSSIKRGDTRRWFLNRHVMPARWLNDLLLWIVTMVERFDKKVERLDGNTMPNGSVWLFLCQIHFHVAALFCIILTIAQLVERGTVMDSISLSLGHAFDSHW